MTTVTSRSKRKCLACIVAGIILQTLIILLFIFLFLRVRTPKVRLSSVSIETLKITNTNSSNRSFNMKLNAQVNVKNTNFGRYKFEDTKAIVSYRGTKVGEAAIAKARARARTTKKLDVTLSINPNKLVLSNSRLSSDLNSKNLTFTALAKLKGKVHVLEIFKKTKSTQMNCTFVVNTSAKTVNDLSCK